MKFFIYLILIFFISCRNEHSQSQSQSDKYYQQDLKEEHSQDELEEDDTYYNAEAFYDENIDEENEEENEDYEGEYFLICTDPEDAYSHHLDYSDVSEYCQGLRSCINRGFEVERLPEDEALDIRADPCDFCFGH